LEKQGSNRYHDFREKLPLSEDLAKLDHIEPEVQSDADSYFLKTKIVEALDVLKPKTKQIFELHKFEGLTYDEIAKYMDISKRTVESNIARALVLLREELRETLKNEIKF